jgi:hypothetical protein
MRGLLLSLASVATGFATYATLSLVPTDVVEVSAREGSTVRAGWPNVNCYQFLGCAIGAPKCVWHCDDIKGCQHGAWQDRQDPTQNSSGSGVTTPKCVDEAACTYQSSDSGFCS